MLDLYDEFGRVVDAFERHGIDYAVCGGFAVMVHGYVRATVDIDLLVRADDIDAALAALDDIGFSLTAGPIPFSPGTPQARVLHRASKVDGSEFLTVDLMAVTPVLEPAWSDRLRVQWREREMRVVSRSGLAHMKRLAGRRKDLLDLEELGLDEE